MRNVLTIIAVVLVAAMSVALVAPLLVDWSAHRAEIEARLSAITGANVSLTGPVDVSLLPTPYLALGEGSLSAPGADGPRLTFASARLELALVKLASGQIRFSDISLQKPVLTIPRGADGALRLPALPTNGLESTGFDRLFVQQGRIRVVGGGAAAAEIGGVGIDASAPSLSGPARVSGQIVGPDNAPVVFRVASEKPGPAGTPLRIEVDAGPSWPAIQFDGALEGDPGAGTRSLRLAGAATLTGTASGEGEPTPWRIVGRTTVDFNRAILREAEFRLGPEERAIRADGEATFVFGSPAQFAIALKAKQANVDALLRRKDEDGVPPARAVAFFTHLVSGALAGRQSRIAIDAKVSAAPIILGAQTLPDATAALTTAPGAPLHLRFDLGLPGDSRLKGEGNIEAGQAPNFRGDVAFDSADFTLLRNWANLGAPPAAAKAAAFGDALPYRSAAFAGAIEASANGFSGGNLKIALDRTTLTGSIAFVVPSGGEASRLTTDLATDSLDVDSLPGLGADPGVFKDLDLSLSLKARSLHIARVGEAEIDSGSMLLEASKNGPNLTLERLSVAGLDGASVEIQGSMNRDATTATGRLRADRLHDFAALIARLVPGEWSRILVERAGELSPALLNFDARGGAESSDAPAIDSLKASGSAGETQFTVALDPRSKDGGRALTVSLDSSNSGALMRQLGLKAAATGNGRAHVSLSAAGSWDQGFDVDATSSLAQSDLSWRGRFLPAAPADEARLFGSAKIKAPNLAPLMTALGLAPTSASALGPAEIGFDGTLRGDLWTFSRLTATIAGAKAAGSLSFRPVAPLDAATQASAAITRAEDTLDGGVAAATPPQRSAPEIEGELSVDRAPLASLLGLALGPPQSAKAGARWSDAKFASPQFRPPPAAIKLKVGTLDLTDALSAQGFATSLRFDKGRLDLDDLAMQVAGGSLSGHATLRRDADTATLTGTLTADSLALDRPGFSGRVGGALDFASTGRSPATLIEGLAGAGTVKFTGAALAHSDPAALDRVVARSQAPDATLDETNIAYAFGVALDKAPLPIPDGSTPMSLSAGVMKFGPITMASPRGSAALTADFDLRRLAVETKLALSLSPADLKFWSGPPPSATANVQNALDGPKRQLDVSALSAGLAAQAIARETDRIAALEADIRERAFFNRRLKGERFMDRRRQEIEDWRAEQERLKGLTDRLRAEEEATKAAQDAADKAAADKPAAAAETPEAVKPALPDGGATTARVPFAPAPPKSDEIGANAPPPATPTPPARPKAHQALPDPTQGGIY